MKLHPLGTHSLALAMTAFGLIGCASHQPETSRPPEQAEAAQQEEESETFESRISKLKLGMTKAQVVSIMDDEGQSVNRSLTPQGTIETVIYTPNFGQRYATALKREFSLGFAGRSDPHSSVMMFKDGRLSSVSSH